ncbi:MAG: M20 family metallopeptidase [Chloroflexota bacterium]|nr:M20 family metallopeptidase [Chloroflexota bacterium]
MADPIVRFLDSKRDAYIADLRLLVGQDSGSHDKAGVDAVMDWLEVRLMATGFDCARNRQARFGDDLIARRHGRGRSKILLLGHADTVYPTGTAAQRPLTIAAGKILGPGTCDMKAGLLTGIFAVAALDEIGWDDYGTITFLIVSDEEIGERHSVPLLMEEGPKHDVILTLEAARDNGDVVTARKAVRWFTVDARGKAAHAGVEPEKGRSATLAIAHFITQAFRLNLLRDGMTVNPGEIAGGGDPNTVAASAKARFDLRAWSNADLDELEARFRQIADNPAVPGVALTVTMEPGSDCPAMERTLGGMRLVEQAIAIAAELGFPLKGAATGGGSDISFAGHRGTPGLDGLGPVGGLDHGPDEYILIESIVPRTALLAKLMMAMGDQTNGE